MVNYGTNIIIHNIIKQKQKAGFGGFVSYNFLIIVYIYVYFLNPG